MVEESLHEVELSFKLSLTYHSFQTHFVFRYLQISTIWRKTMSTPYLGMANADPSDRQMSSRKREHSSEDPADSFSYNHLDTSCELSLKL